MHPIATYCTYIRLLIVKLRLDKCNHAIIAAYWHIRVSLALAFFNKILLTFKLRYLTGNRYHLPTWIVFWLIYQDEQDTMVLWRRALLISLSAIGQHVVKYLPINHISYKQFVKYLTTLLSSIIRATSGFNILYHHF